MGVINTTPDSFSAQGRILDPEKAKAYGADLIADGADIIDVGGESSRPGADPIDTVEEQRRLLPVLEALQGLDAALSVDTYHSETARLALQRGVSMINDITAFRGDPALAEVVGEADCDYVLMHMAGTPKTMQEAPQYDDVVDDIAAFFEERMEFATAHGMSEERIWLDPGFGFGKTIEHNLEILRRLGEFKRFGRPILIGASNKSTIGSILGLPVGERLEGTAATVAIAIRHGADCVRVHDVKAMARVVKMTDAIVRGIE